MFTLLLWSSFICIYTNLKLFLKMLIMCSMNEFQRTRKRRSVKIYNAFLQIDFCTRSASKACESPDYCNKVVDIINKHEAGVHTTAMMKQLGQNFINESAKIIKSSSNANSAPEIIEKYEDVVGRPYERYGGYPDYDCAKTIGTENNGRFPRACSRNSSRAARRGS